MYAPTLSDIDNDEATIVEDKSSILQKIVSNRSKVKKDENLDFAKMEEELRKNGSGEKNVSNDDYYDEDYE